MGTNGTRPLVTLFEAYGSGADVVGPAVAEALGVPWVGQSVSSEELDAADPRGTGRVDVKKFFRTLGFVDIGSIDLIESPESSVIRGNVSSVRELSKDGGVILGRNATVILADEPGALHVKLVAPREDRLIYAARSANISGRQAELRQRREDEARANMSIELWGWDPRTTDRYDLVINTSAFGHQGAIEMILDAYKRKQARLGA
ncbi:MAG TPA: cytidylate kinase-like family protein [Actinomycetaceae bacterium]|nr:cytidylate kinase-like family protein [Actinomycetaceae bacterium]